MDSTKLRVRVRSERKPKSIGKSFYILVTYLEDEYVYNFLSLFQMFSTLVR